MQDYTHGPKETCQYLKTIILIFPSGVPGHRPALTNRSSTEYVCQLLRDHSKILKSYLCIPNNQKDQSILKPLPTLTNGKSYLFFMVHMQTPTDITQHHLSYQTGLGFIANIEKSLFFPQKTNNTIYFNEYMCTHTCIHKCPVVTPKSI